MKTYLPGDETLNNAMKSVCSRFAVKQEHRDSLQQALLRMSDLLDLVGKDNDQGTVDYYMLHLPEMLEYFLEQTNSGNSSEG